MINNRAGSAGGAVFIDTVAGLRLNCSAESKDQALQFYSGKQRDFMKRLTSVDDICTSWENNSAGRYGRDVATSAIDVRKEIVDEQMEALSLVSGSNYTVHKHRSGEPIPLIVLTAVDELGQGPAVGENSEDVEAVMSSPDGFLAGSVRKTLGMEGTTFSATGFVQPGNYRVLIEFEGADLERFEITVEVKPCDIGEVPSGNGTFCESCNAVSFNFSPENDAECRPCPENGDCSSQIILPNDEYWHASPCSKNVSKCLSADACHNKKRVEKLEQLTRDISNCNISSKEIEEYQQAQCEEASLEF